MKNKLGVDDINERIKKECCRKTIKLLKDGKLLDKYKECKSVKKNINILQDILQDQNVSLDKQSDIIKEYIPYLIPPGTKGVIRGDYFIKIIKDHINSLDLSKRFKIRFEKKHIKFPTTEIPDWYIYDKKKNKILIGMNQLDLWSGGQQLNRGSKYLFNNNFNTKNSKLLCVVCNGVKLASRKNKIFKLFNEGFKNDTLCYIKGIKSIVNKFFDL
jgi:hypothetical protein